jgi:hypothetical protein
MVMRGAAPRLLPVSVNSYYSYDLYTGLSRFKTRLHWCVFLLKGAWLLQSCLFFLLLEEKRASLDGVVHFIENIIIVI